MTETMTRLVIDAVGTPAPQGSKQVVTIKGTPRLIDANPRDLKTWRRIVTAAAKARASLGDWTQLDGPISVTLTFWLARPASVTRTYPSVRPDLDKLERAVLDALTIADVIVDDARVVDLRSRKRYAGSDGPTGVHIVIEPVEAVLL